MVCWCRPPVGGDRFFLVPETKARGIAQFFGFQLFLVLKLKNGKSHTLFANELIFWVSETRALGSQFSSFWTFAAPIAHHFGALAAPWVLHIHPSLEATNAKIGAPPLEPRLQVQDFNVFPAGHFSKDYKKSGFQDDPPPKTN